MYIVLDLKTQKLLEHYDTILSSKILRLIKNMYLANY